MASVSGDLVATIGGRVRARRLDRGWTLDELASRSGVSRRMLVNVEQGTANASIATLLRLSEALGVGLPTLVAPSAAGEAIEVTRGGARAPLWIGEHGGSGALAAGVTLPETVELWDWTLEPGDRHASEPHVGGTRELLAVLEGEVTVAAGGEQVVLRAGDAASFRGDVVHGYRNESEARARFALTVFEPTGRGGRP